MYQRENRYNSITVREEQGKSKDKKPPQSWYLNEGNKKAAAEAEKVMKKVRDAVNI